MSKNGLWSAVRITGLYTLSPLHCGIGQVASAVDLPVAREAGSEFPVMPATSLKGAARAFLKERMKREELDVLFGPDLSENGAGERNSTAALLGFTEGRLLAYPMRAFGQPFLYITCPLLLDRFQRDLRALQPGAPWDDWAQAELPSALHENAAVIPESGLNAPLVIEDLVYENQELAQVPWLAETAQVLQHLLPAGETYTRQRFIRYLVSIPDADFTELIRRVVPVRARTQLTDGKTTDTWIDEHSKPHSGNLWYEEYVPPDTLFVACVGQRRPGDSGAGQARHLGLKTIDQQAEALQLVQIGGNETVGHGLCWWSGWQNGREQNVPDGAQVGTPSVRRG